MPGELLCRLIGRVEGIGDVAYVTLFNPDTGERAESQCSRDVIDSAGIGLGDEFACEVRREDGKSTAKLLRLEPKTITREEMKAILDEVNGRWTF